MRAGVDVGEVQGNILQRYSRAMDSALFVRLQVVDRAQARATVTPWLREVSFGPQPDGVSERHVNLAFTYPGLRRWGHVGEALLQAFPPDFREGARRRAEELGDRWQHDWRRFPPADLLLSVYATTPEQCERHVEALLGECRGLRVVGRRAAGEPTAATREHFGFADGLSQPAIEGVDLDAVGNGVHVGRHHRRGQGRRLSLALEELSLRPVERRWRLIRTGEFLLGYDNEDDELPAGPPDPLGPNGTFMVYREIEQHVDVFERYLARAAEDLAMSPAQLGAKILGRWPGGTAVTSDPVDDSEREDYESASGDLEGRRRRLNDFSYADDLEGFGCPLGAHVRRGNPRDALPGGAERTMRHRIIRRGLPYRDRARAGVEHGLAFVCFGASIADGFEYIQRNWLNRGDAFGLGAQPDFLLQQPDRDGALTGRMVIQGYAPTVLGPPDAPFVTVRGCDYLFVPSRRACAWLADLPAPD